MISCVLDASAILAYLEGETVREKWKSFWMKPL